MLQVNGSQQFPVVFTSDSLTPSEGDWGAVIIGVNAFANIDYAIIEYADVGVIFGGGPVVSTITNSIIRNNNRGVETANAARPIVSTNELYNNIEWNYYTEFGGPATLNAQNNWWGTPTPVAGQFNGDVDFSSPLSSDPN